MSASYKKLWKILIDRDMNKSDLIRQAKITSNIKTGVTMFLQKNLKVI